MAPDDAQPTLIVSAECGTEITVNVGGQQVLFKSGESADEPEEDLPTIPPRRGKDPELGAMMTSFHNYADLLGESAAKKDDRIVLASGSTIPEAFFENLSDDAEAAPVVVRVRNKDNG